MIRMIDHINIATQDLAKTRDFFVDTLGFEEGHRPNTSGIPGHWLYVGGRALIHLQLAKAPVSPSRVSAFNHVAFQVTDLDAIAARLDARKIPYRRYEPAGGAFRQIQLEDPNGALVELNCPVPAAAPAE